MAQWIVLGLVGYLALVVLIGAVVGFNQLDNNHD